MCVRYDYGDACSRAVQAALAITRRRRRIDLRTVNSRTPLPIAFRTYTNGFPNAACRLQVTLRANRPRRILRNRTSIGARRTPELRRGQAGLDGNLMSQLPSHQQCGQPQAPTHDIGAVRSAGSLDVDRNPTRERPINRPVRIVTRDVKGSKGCDERRHFTGNSPNLDGRLTSGETTCAVSGATVSSDATY